MAVTELGPLRLGTEDLQRAVKMSREGLRGLGRDVDSIQKNLGQTQKPAADASRGLDKVTRSARKTSEAGKKASRGISGLSGGLVRMAKSAGPAILAAAGLTTGVAALGLAVRSVVTDFVSFNDQMVAVQAVSGATEWQLNQLTGQARELGETTRFSASQAAEAQENLARAGFTVQENLAALPSVLELATAGKMSLATAADIAAGSLRGFQLNAMESGRVSDVLAAAAASANTTVEELGEGLKFVAPTSQSLNVSLEETSGALAVLADNMLKGTLGGTGLRMSLLGILSPTKEAQETLAAFGTTSEEFHRTLTERGLVAALRLLVSSTGDVTDAVALAGSRGGTALQILISNLDSLASKIQIMEDAEGSARRMGDVMDSSVQGGALAMRSAAESLRIELGTALEPTIRSVIGGLTGMFRKLTEVVKPMSDAAQQTLEYEEMLERMRIKTAEAAKETANLAGQMSKLVEVQGLRQAQAAYDQAFDQLQRAEKLLEIVRERAIRTGEGWEEQAQNVDLARMNLEEMRQALVEARIAWADAAAAAEKQEDATGGATARIKQLNEQIAALRAQLQGAQEDTRKTDEELEALAKKKIEVEIELRLERQIVEREMAEFLAHVSPVAIPVEFVSGGPGGPGVRGGGTAFFGFESAMPGETTDVKVDLLVNDDQLQAAVDEGTHALLTGTQGAVDEFGNDLEGHGRDFADNIIEAASQFGQLIGVALSEGAAGFAAALRQAAAGAGRIFANLAQQGGMGEGAAGAIGMGANILGGLLGSTGQTMLGGAAMGAQIGSAIPGLGTAWGAAIGAAVGFAVDALEETAQAFADGSTAGGRLSAQIHDGSGQWRDQTQQAIDAVVAGVNSVLDLLGGEFAEFETFSILIRDDAKGARARVGGIWREFGEDVQAMVDWVITELLSTTEITGVSDIVRAALESSRGKTSQELQEALAAAFTIEALDLSDLEIQLRGQMQELNALLARSFRDFGGTGFEEILLGRNGVVGVFQQTRDQLLGVNQSIEDQTLAQIDALEAQIEVQRAELLVMRARIEQETTFLHISGDRMRADAEMTRVLVETAAASGRSMSGLSEVIGLSGTVAASAGASWATALGAIDEALAALDAMAFTEADRAQALDVARRAAGQANRASREAAARQREAAQRELDLARARAEGGDAAAEELQRQFELEDQVRRTTEALGEAAGEEMRRLLLLEREADLLREIVSLGEGIAGQARPFRDVLETAGMTDIEVTFREIAERAREAGEEIARMVEESGGALGEEGWRAWLDIMAAVEIQRQEAVEALQQQFADFDRSLDQYRNIGPFVQQMDDLGVEFEEHRATLLDLMVQYQAAGLSTSELAARLAELDHLQAHAGSQIQLGFLQSLRSLGVEVPGLAEALVRAEFAMARAQAIALFAGEQATQQWAQSHVDTLMTVAQTSHQVWQTWGIGMVDTTVKVANRIQELLAAAAGVEKPPKIGGGSGLGGGLDFGDIAIPGTTITLQQLLDMLTEAERAAIAAIGAGAGGAGAGGGLSGVGGALRDLASEAESFLSSLDRMEMQALDPIDRINAEFDEMRARALELADAFPELGTSLAEVQARIEALRAEAIAEEMERALGGFRSFLDELRGVGPSGVVGLGGVMAAQAEFEALAARAAAGDVQAMRQLEAAGRDLWQLAQQAGSPAVIRRIQRLILAQGQLALGEGDADPGSILTGSSGGGLIKEPVTLSPADVIQKPVAAEDIAAYLIRPMTDELTAVRRQLEISEDRQRRDDTTRAKLLAVVAGEAVAARRKADMDHSTGRPIVR